MPSSLGHKGGSASSAAPAPTTTPDYDWEASFLKSGLSPQAASTAAGYISRGMEPAVALHMVYSLGLDRAPESQWDTFTKDHPIQAATKKLLVTGGRDLKEFASPLGGAIPNPVHQAEKLSAAKMLKEYLMHQDMQRANEATKDALWQQVHNAQVQDQFFVDNKRPPASLGDFALAGMNFRPQTPQEVPTQPMVPRLLPGTLAK